MHAEVTETTWGLRYLIDGQANICLEILPLADEVKERVGETKF
jgi:hypothetical protein